MLVILSPSAFNARTADSRPGPGPLIRTSRFLTPHSCAARPAASAATCAANGVDLREPLKPAPPEVAHPAVLRDADLVANLLGLGRANAMDVAQADFDPLLGWNIDAGNARHLAAPSASGLSA